jgi:hypothetical protein
MSVGYELHITRAQDWSTSATKPITQTEWSSIAVGDPRLARTAEATAFTLGGADGPVLYWVADQINVKGIDDPAQITELSDVARLFDAVVQGDDGEVYAPAPGSS